MTSDFHLATYLRGLRGTISVLGSHSTRQSRAMLLRSALPFLRLRHLDHRCHQHMKDVYSCSLIYPTTTMKRRLYSRLTQRISPTWFMTPMMTHYNIYLKIPLQWIPTHLHTHRLGILRPAIGSSFVSIIPSFGMVFSYIFVCALKFRFSRGRCNNLKKKNSIEEFLLPYKGHEISKEKIYSSS